MITARNNCTSNVMIIQNTQHKLKKTPVTVTLCTGIYTRLKYTRVCMRVYIHKYIVNISTLYTIHVYITKIRGLPAYYLWRFHSIPECIIPRAYTLELKVVNLPYRFMHFNSRKKITERLNLSYSFPTSHVTHILKSRSKHQAQKASESSELRTTYSGQLIWVILTLHGRTHIRLAIRNCYLYTIIIDVIIIPLQSKYLAANSWLMLKGTFIAHF